MSDVTDFDSLRRAMADNSEEPEGPARNARAEQLLAEAEKLNVPLAVIEALGHQLKVYNYSSEKDKMFVPFARLLRMWDERPEDFDEYETHSLHWVFKWMSSGMLDQPHVPLASIEKWLGEMEHRYRLAGHSERAVRSAEFSVAAHVGDVARAERAYAAWLAADRDSMADCHACELHVQGWWQAERGRDAEAIRLWGPVLAGEFTCAHEPHTVLASSLAPLLRLGRLDEARAHHLRGFRLVRAMESMRGAYADHVEFCALSGNEARGLELLAERPAYFTDDGHPRSKLEFMAVVALLMDRLSELGLGDQRVPGPAGRDWTARELAAHARGEALALAAGFDRRNGTAHVSERARARMDQRPLVERLPLGVRTAAARPTGVAAPAPATANVAGGSEGAAAEPDLAALLIEARRLSDTLQPHAIAAWAAVSRAAEGVELTARDRAEIADHQAMDLGPQGIALFEEAAGLYAEAGDPGEALAAHARGAYVRALTGDVPEALAVVADLYDRVLALYAEDGTGVRQTAAVLMSRARILMRRAHEAEGATQEAGRGDPPAAPGGGGGRGGPGGTRGRGQGWRRPWPPPGPPRVRCSRSSTDGPGTTYGWPREPRRGKPCSRSWRRSPGTWSGPRSCSPGLRRRSSGRGCRGSRWSTRPGWPGSRTISATPPRPSGRCGRPWSTAGRTWRRPGGPSCTSSWPRCSVAGGWPRRPRSTPWRRRTGPTRRVRAGRWGPGRGSSSAGSCCIRGGSPRPPRSWSRRCPT